MRAGYFLIVILATLAVPVRAERLPIKIYTTADGLPHNEINRIVRDSRGFLWFCTGDGLSRFDGYSFTNFGVEHGLPHRTVNDLLETRDGQYWVATSGGLVRFDPTGVPHARVVYSNQTTSPSHAMFTVIVPEDAGPQARVVTKLLADRSGTIWAGTWKGLQRLEGDTARPVLRAIEMGIPRAYVAQAHISDLLEAHDGTLWVASDSGLYRRDHDGTARRYTNRDGLPTNWGQDGLVRDLLEDRQGQLWAATINAGFFRFSADASGRLIVGPVYSLENGLPANWVFQLFQQSDGSFWIGTNRGLVQVVSSADGRGAQFRVHTASHGLSFHEVTALNEDAGGNLWLGTNTAGAMKLARSGFTTYGEADGLASVGALAEDPAGGLCFRGAIPQWGASPAGSQLLMGEVAGILGRFGRFDGHEFTWFAPDVFRPKYGLGWAAESAVLRTRCGEWWLGADRVLFRFPASGSFAQVQRARPLARYTVENGALAAVQVFQLFEDSREGVWVSTAGQTSHGLARWDRSTDTWQDLGRPRGVPSFSENLARSFGEDGAGDVWIGLNIGVTRHRAGTFRHFSERDGLPPGAIVNMYLDRGRRLWLASARSGLIRVESPESERPVFVTYTTAEGLSTNSTEVITEDLYGRIYVGTGRGLDRLDPATGSVRHFTTADGLAQGLFAAAFRDHTGALWFGMTGGLSRFEPTSDPPVAPPPILISRLVVAGSTRPMSAIGERAIALPDLQPWQSSVQIDYVGLDFAPGETLRYQYKLGGADATWSAPTNQRSVNFGNLAPGRYQFLVRAVTGEGVESPVPAAVTFTILRPVWLRWWFLATAVAFAAAAATKLYRYRTARLLELANVRTRIALDLHDDIGSNLTRISILSEVARQQLTGIDAADEPLSAIARISRESVAAMSDIVWAINPQRDRVLDLVQRMRLHADEVCTSRGLALTFRAPDEAQATKLSVNVRRDVFLIFKEAINNLSRHSRCSHVDIVVKTSGASLSVEIADDGVGFNLSDAAPDRQGLVSMRRRAGVHGGLCEVRSTPGRGTVVRVTLPLSSRRRVSRMNP